MRRAVPQIFLQAYLTRRLRARLAFRSRELESKRVFGCDSLLAFFKSGEAYFRSEQLAIRQFRVLLGAPMQYDLAKEVKSIGGGYFAEESPNLTRGLFLEFLQYLRDPKNSQGSLSLV